MTNEEMTSDIAVDIAIGEILPMLCIAEKQRSLAITKLYMKMNIFLLYFLGMMKIP